MPTRFFPFVTWLRGYDVRAFRLDFVSGLTVALVLIPQSMAYAQLAGLPAHYGLYASFLPPIVAALFGSSRQLATGPVAVVSLMTSASLEPLATAGSSEYIAYAILLALMVGVLQLALGLLRLGLVINLLSHPVANGFTNAAAIIIASSQLSKLLGVSVDKAEHHYQTIARVFRAAAHETHWPTVAMGVLAFSVMLLLRRLQPRLPNVLVAVALTTLISWATGFHHERTVPAEAIRSPAVHLLIQEHNSTVEGIEEASTERASAMARLAEDRNRDNDLAALETRYRADVLSARIEHLKRLDRQIRSAMREIVLIEVGDQEGGLALYLEAEAPPEAAGAARSWRLEVGARSLDPAAIRVVSGGAVVGTIPAGLPTMAAPELHADVILRLLPFAAIIFLLGFMEAMSIAKAMAARTGQRLDPNQELIGQGLANIVGAVGRSYPTSGSFSRSAVNLQSGARTGLSSVITGLTVVATLLFFTPLLFHLPQAVLAAVIMMAVIGLVNVSGFVHAWQAQPHDGIISVITFASTLVLAPHLERGIAIGVVLSLLVFLYKSMRPTVATVSRLEDDSYRAAAPHHLAECAYIDTVRFDAPLFFANASYLEDQINEHLANKPKLKHIVIVGDGINDMDASGEETLSLLVDRVRSAGVEISFSGVTEAVVDLLERTYLIEKIGRDRIFPTLDKAIRAIHADAHEAGEEERCPLTTVCHVD